MNQLNNIITIVICFLAVLCLWYSLKNPNDRVRYGQYAVVLGIFGTFLGITLGLYSFNVMEIDKSIPDLLSGLKTAFVTSLAGQFVSLIINSNRIFGFFLRLRGTDLSSLAKDKDGRPKELDISDIVNALNSIKNSIVGDGETALITQIQKMRISTTDSLDELNKSFKDYSKHMVENTNNAIIEALREVIRDFNAKINEQFGENFKQLNSSVEKMIIWQDQYKSFIQSSEEKLTKTLEYTSLAVETIDKTGKSLESIEKLIGDISNSTEGMIVQNEKAIMCINDFSGSVKTMHQIAEQSKNLFPSLENNVQTVLKSADALLKNTSEKISLQQDSLTQNYETSRKVIESLINQTKDNLEKQVTKLDEELGKELNKSLTSLGNQLASLSKKFVDDYTPLTEKLKVLVESSRRL